VRQAIFDSLAVNVRGEGTEDEGKVREDVFGAFGNAQGLLTPPIADFIGRVDGEYRAGVTRYNAFVTGSMPGINATLQQAGKKPVTSIKTVNAL
jgi:hypothetical protein